MAAFTWNVTPASDVTLVTNLPDESLAAFDALFTANEGGANAKWEVVEYASSSPRSLLLRRQNGAPGRIVLFGQQGSTPNAAAVQGTAGASRLYIGYSATSTSNTVDASYLAGAPLAASDYIPGVPCSVNSAGEWRFSYAEFDDGVYFIMTSASVNGWGMLSAGETVLDYEGNLLSAVQGSGSNGSTTWATAVANAGSIIPANVAASYTGSTDAGLIVRYDGANRAAFRATALASGVAAKLKDEANSIAHFMPISLVFNSSDVAYSLLGQMRQVGFGPLCLRETVLDFAGVFAYGQTCGNVAPATLPGFWFVDEEI